MINPDIAQRYELKQTAGAYIISDGSVSSVIPGSPAEKAGLKEGDVITKVDGVELAGNASLAGQLAQFSPGERVKLTVMRDDQERTLEVTLGRYE